MKGFLYCKLFLQASAAFQANVNLEKISNEFSTLWVNDTEIANERKL